jgi:antitoxin component YwqK of YwqJK toxin-antitoxin module
VPHDLQKYYFENGQLGSEYHMKNGLWHGIFQHWHRDGRRHFVQQWKNDQINKPMIIFRYEL